MKKGEKILAVCVLVSLVFFALWWHEAHTYKTRYSETRRYYLSSWIAENAALLRAFSTDALSFIGSSNDTGAVISIRHTRTVMISFREPLYVTALYLGSEFNGSVLEMTQTDSCVSFLSLSMERIKYGDEKDIQIIREGLVEIQNFSNQLLKQYPLTGLASEQTLRKNWGLQNRCRIGLRKLGKRN